MELIRFRSVQAFVDATADFLNAHDPYTNAILANCARLTADPSAAGSAPAYMAAVTGDRHDIKMVAMMMPPYPLSLYGPDTNTDAQTRAAITAAIVSDLSHANGDDAQSRDGEGPDVPGVLAPRTTARQFVDAWCATTGQTAHVKMQMRLYRLLNVSDALPSAPAGALRPGREQDLETVARWHVEMDREAVGNGMSIERAVQIATGKLESGSLYVWDDGDGPVTMACAVRPTSRGVVINSVYTPPTQRSRGFATACVAALSQRMLDTGHEFCSLFTDLSNPTSNSIYMKIGYEPLGDVTECAFTGQVRNAP